MGEELATLGRCTEPKMDYWRDAIACGVDGCVGRGGSLGGQTCRW